MMELRIIKDKRGTWSFADIVKFVFFILLSAGIASVIFLVARNAYDSQKNTANLEHFILSDRLFSVLSYKDDNTGRIYPGILKKREFDEAQITNAFAIGSKRIAFSVTLGDKSSYFNKEFYDIAKPLAPIRYENIISENPVNIMEDKTTAKIVIDQVFPE